MSQLIKPWFDPDNNQNYFCVMWNLTRQCNCCCVGCPFHNNINNNICNYKDVINFIKNNFNFNSQYNQIILFGGEPTLHKKFINIIDELSKLNIKNILLFSNFSENINIYNYCIDKNIQLILTYHNNLFNNIYLFTEKLLTLKNNNINIILMKDDNVDNNYNYLKQNNFNNISIVSTHKLKNNILDTENNKNQNVLVLDENNNTKSWSDIIENNKNCFYNYKCVAGKLSYYIEENGNIFPCQGIGQDYYVKNKNEKFLIGNVKSIKKINLNNSTICPQKACRFELFLTKEKQ